jgi:molybdate transport system substrate-binding protein
MDELRHIGHAKLAIANPRLAPYGVAAKDFLEAEGLWDRLQPNLVMGENISQALQFAASGGARFGLVAASQLALPGLQAASCAEHIAHADYTPIRQQLVLLQGAEHNAAARRFLAYLQGADAEVIIENSGYGFEDTAR